jgi:endonuclease G, mitochondrial
MSNFYKIGRMQFPLLTALAFSITSLASTPAAAEDRNCTASEKAEGDRQLWLSAGDKSLSLSTHLPWGQPRETSPTTHERTLVQRDYVIRYDDDLRVPVWTAERLVFDRIGKVDGRVNCFRPDPRIPVSASAKLIDYEERIYDRGHSTPDADQDSSITAAVNSYMLSNMSPQTCQFNRGIWQILESIVRLWAKEHATVYVISGSVFDRDGDGRRDRDSDAPRMESNNGQERVAVPSAFFKLITRQKADGSLETLSVLLPHDNTRLTGDPAVAYLRGKVTSVAALERVTGLDFFPTATASLGESTALWPIVGRPSRNLCG